MRMAARRRGGMLELAEMRLPLIALIDVILFLLMYFLLAGSLESEERELAAAIGSGTARAADSGGLSAQVVDVLPEGGRPRYVLGARTARDAAELAAMAAALPKEPGIVVRVSDGVSVEDATAALEACRTAGFAKIAYQPSPDRRQGKSGD